MIQLALTDPLKSPISRMQMIPCLRRTPNDPVCQLGHLPREMRAVRMVIFSPGQTMLLMA